MRRARPTRNLAALQPNLVVDDLSVSTERRVAVEDLDGLRRALLLILVPCEDADDRADVVGWWNQCTQRASNKLLPAQAVALKIGFTTHLDRPVENGGRRDESNVVWARPPPVDHLWNMFIQ